WAMGLGQSSRDVYCEAPRATVLMAIHQAARDIGHMLETNDILGSVLVQTSFGLQSVKLRVSVVPSGTGSLVQVQGASDDVWGAGGRKGADKFFTALGRRLADPQPPTRECPSCHRSMPREAAECPQCQATSDAWSY